MFAGNGDVDEAATAGQRDELRADRVHITLGAANDDVFDGPRRRFLLSPQIAERLDVRENDLVELCTGDGPGVRGWAGIDQGVRADTLMLGPAGMRLLSAAPGDRVEIRAAPPRPGDLMRLSGGWFGWQRKGFDRG